MKKITAVVLSFVLALSFSVNVYAVGEGNVDGGGGGMGSGTNQNKWIPGEDGVRVTVIRSQDGAIVTIPIDVTNIKFSRTVRHFGKYCKLSYRNGLALNVSGETYTYFNPSYTMPKIVPSNSGGTSIPQIKKYFCSEYIIRIIADETGMNYDTLIGGQYKLLLEPIAYFLYNGTYYAMTATEAALYDKILSGNLRAKMCSLSHKNLPLSMFLEKADLGYSAWTGSTSSAVSNDTIIGNLGIGIVRFNENDITEMPDTDPAEYIYRTDTDVITAVKIDADKEYNPDNPLSVNFKILTNNYVVKNIVIPDGESQLAWVKWHTPTKPQDIKIRVTIGSKTRYVTVKVEDLIDNEPPDPKANDKNPNFKTPGIPKENENKSLSWGVWTAKWHAYWVWVEHWVWTSNGWVDKGKWEDHGWYDFTYNSYTATLSVTQSITPDSKVPTKKGSTIKSGYGFNTSVSANISTNATNSAYTQAQTSLMYFPEFEYKTYFRVLEKTVKSSSSSFKFKENKYSTYKSRAHFTPIWYPDGKYTVYAKTYDAWTPAGMLSVNLTPQLTISGNMFSDWHIAPKN